MMKGGFQWKYIVVNIYNKNTEQNKLFCFLKCISLLETIQDILHYEIFMGGDFNLIPDS